MIREAYPLYVGGRPETTAAELEVTNKVDGSVAARVALADAAVIDRAIAAAASATPAMAALPAHARQRILLACVDAFEARAEELAQLLCAEAGKPIRASRGEVTRLVDTFRIAAEEAVRIYGEVMPMDIAPRTEGYRGMWKRVPAGPCGFITPFNFPLNLVAHKVAPAIAAGCSFVLKPASTTPIGALVIGEVLAETELPEGAFSILPCPGAVAEQIVTDERLKRISFTGSPAVGWALKAKAGKKKVSLELGGNAAVIVDADTDIEDVVQRILVGAFYQSGQSCISVQRIIAHASIYEPLRDALVEATRALVTGDPREEATFVGPLITEDEARRVEAWIGEAVSAGARLLCGGEREGALVSPALLEDVDPALPLASREVFGPVAVLSRFEDFEAALAEANASKYGLQAGVFTKRLDRALRAWDALEVGGVVVGDVPSWRVDHMPYGGVKDSGLGREGIRFAIEDMTEMRLLVIRDAGL